MKTADQSVCKGCGSVIVTPGPRITFTGVEGEFHLTCSMSAAVIAEREACVRVVREYAERMKAAGDAHSAHFVLNAADYIENLT